MDVESAIRGRRSIRRYRAEAVPEAAVREVLELARWAPSWANTQGWSLFALTGETLERLVAALRERSGSGAERRFDLPPEGPDWPAAMRARTEQLFAARQAAAPGAAPPPTANVVFDLFGAPWLVLFAFDERLGAEYACFDSGLLVQTFCLAAHAKGLGTCIMARAVAYADVLHELLPEAAGLRFVVGVALGVPDLDAPVNGFPRQRADLDELVRWAR